MGMAAGWPLILAARAAEKGASLAECTALAREGLANTGTIGTVDALDHLQRSGRIGLAQSYVGTLLNVKPLLEVREGQFAPAGQVRTRKKALTQLVEMTVERVNGRSPVYLSVIHADAADDAKNLLDRVGKQLKLEEAAITEFSPNAALQVGPSAIGVQFVAGVSEQ
jgi:DegV family protein with EDD domain